MRGGARPGAGRKRTDGKRVTVTARVSPRTKEVLKAMKAEGMGIGKILDDAADTYIRMSDK